MSGGETMMKKVSWTTFGALAYLEKHGTLPPTGIAEEIADTALVLHTVAKRKISSAPYSIIVEES